MNERQTKFCLAYAKSGNAYEAYKEAGYNMKSEASARVSASRLLTNDNIVTKLAELSERSHTKAIATITEIKEFWTEVLLSEENEMNYRLKASELLVKVEGGFIDKVEHSGAIVKRVINVNPSKAK